jgi:hypothetical protein
MTTGRINQVTILIPHAPARAGGAGRPPEGARVVKRKGLARQGSPGFGSPPPEPELDGEGSQRSHPIAPTGFPSAASAADREPPLGGTTRTAAW